MVFQGGYINTVIMLFLQGWCFNAPALFFMLVIVDVPPLIKGQEKGAIMIKVADNLIDVYIIDNNEFFHFNFIIPMNL